MSIEKKKFGVTKDGQEVTSYILKNANGMEAVFIDYGACLTKLLVPDAQGKLTDVVLGFDHVSGYENDDANHGAFVGRNGNRIGGATFELNGKRYELAKNDGPNNLHSGPDLYGRKMYEVEFFEGEGEETIEFSRLSPDMEQGFPGNLDLTVTYTLTDDNALVIEYFAVSDQDTVVNFTNHSYFNLAGHNAGTILDHKVEIKASHFAITDGNLIPTGELVDVKGTPMDFTQLKRIGDEIEADYEPLKLAGGYDHHFEFDSEEEDVRLVAQVVEESKGIIMEMYSDLPGTQFYVGNFISGKAVGKDGYTYQKRDGLCLETQYIPDSVNMSDLKKNAILKAGVEFDSTTIYKFGTLKR